MADYVKLLAAAGDAVANKNRHPFAANGPIRASSPGAAVIHGVNRADEQSGYNLYFDGFDGAITTIDEDDLSDLANANAATTLDADTYLEVVVEINGMPVTRVDDDTVTVPAGSFKVSIVSTKVTITFGTAYAAGTRARIYIAEPVGTTVASATIPVVVEEATLVAGEAQDITCYDFMRATVANTVIEAIPGL